MIVHYLVWRDAHEHVLPLFEGITLWIQQRNVVIAVASFGAPTPVHMDEALFVITVNHKGMPTFGLVRTRIIQRSTGIQFLIDDGHPLQCGIIITIKQIDTGIIAEVLDQTMAGLVGIGSRSARRIFHTDGNATLHHQR